MTIFKDVVFYLEALPPTISQQLEAHGATRAILPDDWERLTHVIAPDLSYETARLAHEKGIPVVNEQWVNVSIRRKHLQNIKYFSADPRYFFTGVVIICVDLSSGDRDAIYSGISALGGQYTEILSKSVTHIITLDMNNETCNQALMRPDLGIKILLPHWFNDCLKYRQRLDETPYLLSNPSINTKCIDLVPETVSALDKSSISSQQLDVKSSESTKQILKHRKILFSKDLEICQKLLRALEVVVSDFGAIVVSSLDDATVFIGMYREGDEYVQAARRGIIIGNLVWLYWIFVYETWVNPEQNLLHYPIVKYGLPEMRNMIITISNYQGESRKYLEKLIEALGATFTKNMKPNNTHLITPCKSGQKYMAALEWNICVVNHLWLEETYAKWELQNVSMPRYTCFSPQINLIEIVGNTPIDMNVVRSFYENTDHDITIDTKSPLKESNLLDYSNSYSLNNDKLPIDLSSSPLNSSSIPRSQSLSTFNEYVSPSGCDSSIKENLPSFHKRKAATIALEKLHNEIMPDILLYQKECKRKTFSDSLKDVRNVRKRSKELSINHENVKDTSVINEKTSKTKISTEDKNYQKYDIRILITGYNNWNSQIEKTLLTLGIKTVHDAKYCTHLIASRIQRTQKFLSALPYAPKVLSLDWIMACLKEKRIVDENDYFLTDPESEIRYNFKLKESLDRASKNKCSLFKGYLFQVSPTAVSNYNNGIDAVKQIIEANGGVCVSTFSRRNETEYETLLPILISTDLDEKDLKQYVEKRRQIGQEPLVYNMEWVLTTVLRQELKFTTEKSFLEK